MPYPTKGFSMGYFDVEKILSRQETIFECFFDNLIF